MLSIRRLRVHEAGRNARILVHSTHDVLVERYGGDLELERGRLRESSGLNRE